MASGKPTSVVITRSRDGNEELATMLKRAGLDPIIVDTISITPPDDWKEVDGFLGRLGEFDWVAFTSATGAKYFGARMKALSLRVPWEGRPKVAAVGRRTAHALSSFGLKTDFLPSVYTTERLGGELPAARGDRILLLRADIAEQNLSARLQERGLAVENTAIYRTLLGRGPAPKLNGAGLIVFASPSAVKGFCRIVDKEELGALRRLKAVCIGPVTESAAKQFGFLDTAKPESYTLDSVVSEVRRLSKGSD